MRVYKIALIKNPINKITNEIRTEVSETRNVLSLFEYQNKYFSFRNGCVEAFVSVTDGTTSN